MPILRKLFGFREPVDRKFYLTWGLILMAVKYLGEIALVWHFEHIFLDPVSFVLPYVGTMHLALGGPKNSPFFWLAIAWTLPFIWIAWSMSVRRAENAGVSPWWATLLFVPALNLVMMVSFAVIQARPAKSSPLSRPLIFSGVVGAMAVMSVICFTVLLLSVNGMSRYGSGLFLGSPLLAGLMGGYILNRDQAYTRGQTLLAALIGMILVFGIFILIAAEGIVCLVMAAPLTLALAFPAALMGRSLALRGRGSLLSLSPALLMVPGLLGYDLLNNERPLFEVYSAVEIAAPPEKIWPIVIAFPELAPPTEALFKAGIAYPIRARIEGEGVGAVRYCEFSTGPFVEPITAWQPGERLAFNVTSNPRPMTEFNPIWKDVDAPHLHGFMESERGEFRFVKLPNGHTRLEGRTWYRQGLFPQMYWKQFSDEIIHRIHLRVLDHIKRIAEN